MSRRWNRKDILTIPNAMSLFRLLLIPVIIWLYCRQENYLWAAIITALSAATDIADGKIARKFHMVSDFGKVLDPVADKMTQMALLLCLLSRYSFLWLMIVLFVIKEGLMAFWGYLSLRFTNAVNGARWYGKLSTVILYATILLLFLFPQLPETTVVVMAVICAVTMLLSLILYGRFYSQILSKEMLRDKWEKLTVWLWRVLLAAIWTVVILLILSRKDEFTIAEILAYTPSNPILAAIMILLLFALKSVSIVLYSGILYAVNGILFALPIAILLNVMGTVIMVTIPYLIGRKTGSAATERIIKKYPKANQLKEFRQENDFFLVFCVRLLGLLPCDIVSLYMGAIRVDYGKYLLECIMGMLPPSVTFPIMGMSITDVHSPMFITAFCAELFFMASSFFLYRIYRRKKLLGRI